MRRRTTLASLSHNYQIHCMRQWVQSWPTPPSLLTSFGLQLASVSIRRRVGRHSPSVLGFKLTSSSILSSRIGWRFRLSYCVLCSSLDVVSWRAPPSACAGSTTVAEASNQYNTAVIAHTSAVLCAEVWPITHRINRRAPENALAVRHYTNILDFIIAYQSVRCECESLAFPRLPFSMRCPVLLISASMRVEQWPNERNPVWQLSR